MGALGVMVTSFSKYFISALTEVKVRRDPSKVDR